MYFEYIFSSLVSARISQLETIFLFSRLSVALLQARPSRQARLAVGVNRIDLEEASRRRRVVVQISATCQAARRTFYSLWFSLPVYVQEILEEKQFRLASPSLAPAFCFRFIFVCILFFMVFFLFFVFAPATPRKIAELCRADVVCQRRFVFALLHCFAGVGFARTAALALSVYEVISLPFFCMTPGVY